MSSTNPIQISYEDARRLSVAVLDRAFSDARGVEWDNQVEALAWLASTRAEVYFDLLEIPQSSALIHSGWMELAEDALWDPKGDPKPIGDADLAQISTIITTHAYLRTLNHETT